MVISWTASGLPGDLPADQGVQRVCPVRAELPLRHPAEDLAEHPRPQFAPHDIGDLPVGQAPDDPCELLGGDGREVQTGRLTADTTADAVGQRGTPHFSYPSVNLLLGKIT